MIILTITKEEKQEKQGCVQLLASYTRIKKNESLVKNE